MRVSSRRLPPSFRVRSQHFLALHDGDKTLAAVTAGIKAAGDNDLGFLEPTGLFEIRHRLSDGVFGQAQGEREFGLMRHDAALVLFDDRFMDSLGVLRHLRRLGSFARRLNELHAPFRAKGVEVECPFIDAETTGDAVPETAAKIQLELVKPGSPVEVGSAVDEAPLPRVLTQARVGRVVEGNRRPVLVTRRIRLPSVVDENPRQAERSGEFVENAKGIPHLEHVRRIDLCRGTGEQ
jgi:hypothetical protein